MDKKLLGSQTAKGGFSNEHDIILKFNQWKNDSEAQKWLEVMGYDLAQLKNVTAIHIPLKIKKIEAIKYGGNEDDYEKFIKFKKADVQIKLIVQIGEILRIENISLKKANSGADFNQIDKRSVESYKEMWNFDEEMTFWLKLFSGEFLVSSHKNIFSNNILDRIFREEKRIFIDEMPKNIQGKIISFFDKNRILVVSDVLRGRGGLAADWILVTKRNANNTTTWILKDINTVMNFYGSGEVRISPRGSLSIGKIFLQRKGGTPDPTKLQFKFKPCELFKLG